MKTLIAAALLLALIGPVHAFDFTAHCDTHGCDAAATPYQEGMRHYREGLCYRARPYLDGPEAKLWERGYDAQQKKEHNTRDWSHCHPGSLIDKHK